MPYTPAASYNYTPMTLDQIQGGQGNSAATAGMEFARWAAGQGIDLANLARTDRNTQLSVQNAFQQQQADRANALQQQQFSSSEQQRQLQNAAAIRAENWSRSLSNPEYRNSLTGGGSTGTVAPDAQLYAAQQAALAQSKKQKEMDSFSYVPQVMHW